MCADTSRGATVRDLLVKGLKVTLSPTEQEVYYCSLILDMRIKSLQVLTILLPILLLTLISELT